MTTEVVLTGIGVILGTGAATCVAFLKKWPFKSSNSKHKGQCDVPDCHDLVIVTASEVSALKDGQKEIFKKIDDMPDKIVNLLKDTKGLIPYE